MSRRAFTVLEMMVAVVIITILVSMATLGYQGYRDRAAMLVDETNQKILQGAVKLYAYDNNALPASLSELRPGDVQRAYALVTSGKERYTLLAHLKESVWGGVAHAQEEDRLEGRYYNNDAKVLDCPSDSTSPTLTGGVSYSIAPFWRNQANRTLRALLNPANADRELLIEADTRNAAAPVFRHGRGRISVEVTAGGTVRRREKPPDDGPDGPG